MRIAILADSRSSFPKIMAEGLKRMFDQLGVTSTIFYNGLEIIRARSASAGQRSAVRRLRDAIQEYRLRRYVSIWQEYDVLIIVGHNPAAFMRGFWDDARLRAWLPSHPIILYDLVYLGTRGEWKRWLQEGNPALGIPVGGNFGLERYDWYLCVSIVSEHAMPQRKQPVSLIGVHLDDGSLRAGEQTDFVALLDFARNEHTTERQVQKQALREAKIKWVELTDSYSISKIRSIYRKSSLYFVAHRESFGLPICELQACGGTVFSPYADWCPSHWMKDDISVAGPGVLSKNFVIYDNDPKFLVTKLKEISSSYDPLNVRETLLQRQPQLYYGDLSELQKFVDFLESGYIHPKLHNEHK
jgi:hypothetical protein